MNSSKLIKRIVTCQGSIQLVTALSVLDYREQEQEEDYQYENYLVIYDLNSPPGQIDAFADFIKKMATLVCNWKQIVYITPEQMKVMKSDRRRSNPSSYFRRVSQLIGTDSTDEIYLSPWQFGNQLLTNTYQSAEKICYGDSIGIYFAPDSKAFFLTQSLPKRLLIKLWKKTIDRTKSILGSTVLSPINFDRGYFTLPDILGEIPPMPVTVPDKTSLLKVFGQLKSLLDQDYISQLHQRIGDAPVSILLTSNFSEAGRMTLQQEIEAYQQFLRGKGISDRSVLIIKPHPRDSSQKILTLKDTLQELYTQVIVLSATSLFFMPFEVFFTEAFLDESLKLTNKVEVFACSSACLSLKLLFNVPSFIGFGSEITNSFFDQDYAPGRIKHEQDLRTALTKI